MDKRKAHTLCAAVALLVFAALLAMDVWLVVQVRGLREQLELRSTETDNRIAFFRDHVDNQHSLLLERLEQQGSLFSSQSAALDYVGGTVTLTVTVVPRELRQDESLLLTVDGARTADFRPDETGTLCDPLAAEDPRVRALHRPNGGAGPQRQACRKGCRYRRGCHRPPAAAPARRGHRPMRLLRRGAAWLRPCSRE